MSILESQKNEALFEQFRGLFIIFFRANEDEKHFKENINTSSRN